MVIDMKQTELDKIHVMSRNEMVWNIKYNNAYCVKLKWIKNRWF